MAIIFKKEGLIMSESAKVLAKLRKDMGDQIGQQGVELRNIERIPTGIFPLDLATGGGVPKGRVSIIYGAESSGKTALAYLLMADVQRSGKKAVYLDIESSLDSSWAVHFGIDLKELIVITPAFAEQAVDVVEAMLYASDVGIVVIDSIAAMTTDNEIASSAEKMNVGGNSYVIGKMIRKAVTALSREAHNNHYPALVCLNQVRVKIGQLFGNPECLHADTLINFVDGRSIPIRQVVEQKLQGEVWGYDAEIKEFRPCAIEAYHHNHKGAARDGDFMTITSKGIGTKNGVLSATSSYTHKFMTTSGWKEARDLSITDRLITKAKYVLPTNAINFILGVLCGDVSVNTAEGALCSSLRFMDSANQEYLKWKVSLLSPYMTFKTISNRRDYPIYHSSASYELFELAKAGRDPLGLLNSFTWLGFSVWIMDDGYFDKDHNRYTLAIGRYRSDISKQEDIRSKLKDLGLICSWSKSGKNLTFTVASSKTIAEAIAEFVPSSMQYKLPEYLVGAGDALDLGEPISKYVPVDVPIVSIVEASPRKYRDRGMYDLSISDCGTYMCGNLDNGFVVHNTFPGGNSLRFASSLTIKLYGKDEILKEVNPAKPTFKVVTGSIQKAKLPILSKAFEYNLTLIPHGNLKVGQAPTWNFIATYCRNAGMLTQAGVGKPWGLLGKSGATQKELKQLYETDITFSQAVHTAIIDQEANKGTIKEVEESIDPDTGEILKTAG